MIHKEFLIKTFTDALNEKPFRHLSKFQDLVPEPGLSYAVGVVHRVKVY